MVDGGKKAKANDKLQSPASPSPHLIYSPNLETRAKIIPFWIGFCVG